MENIIESLQIFDWIQYNIVDLQKSIPCWTKWHNEPKVVEYCGIIAKNHSSIELPI